MHDLHFFPISCTDFSLLSRLMKEEENAWMQQLGWDYAPVREILESFMEQKLLPGYVAILEKKAAGYIYFLTNGNKGMLGNVYVKRSDHSEEISDALLSLGISGLRELPRIQRVEAQIMPFNDLSFTEIFIRKGFQYYPRSYLTMDMASFSIPETDSGIKIVPWNDSFLLPTAEIILSSYKNQPDADICSDYSTLSGCESYLRSIMNNPGCGFFMPEASCMALDENKVPCGFVLGSRISKGTGMIPQIAVKPDYRGRKLGHALMARCLNFFKSRDFRKVTLTVTNDNRTAYQWYCRLGFSVSKEFGAFSWTRGS
jgi:ribosomal protein S18 acetylase RimI-like enzyme